MILSKNSLIVPEADVTSIALDIKDFFYFSNFSIYSSFSEHSSSNSSINFKALVSKSVLDSFYSLSF